MPHDRAISLHPSRPHLKRLDFSELRSNILDQVHKIQSFGLKQGGAWHRTPSPTVVLRLVQR